MLAASSQLFSTGQPGLDTSRKPASSWVLPRREPEPASGRTKEEAEIETKAAELHSHSRKAAAASESAQLAVM